MTRSDHHGTSMTDADGLAAASLRLAEAIVSNDADAIATCLDESWRMIDADGVTTREGFLDVVRCGALTHSMMRPLGELDIRQHGDVGIVVSRIVNTAHFGGQTFDADEWTTDVFVLRDGRWLCAHTHVTPARRR